MSAKLTDSDQRELRRPMRLGTTIIIGLTPSVRVLAALVLAALALAALSAATRYPGPLLRRG